MNHPQGFVTANSETATAVPPLSMATGNQQPPPPGAPQVRTWFSFSPPPGAQSQQLGTTYVQPPPAATAAAPQPLDQLAQLASASPYVPDDDDLSTDNDDGVAMRVVRAKRRYFERQYPDCPGLRDHHITCDRPLFTMEDQLVGHCSSCRRALESTFQPQLMEMRRQQTLVKMAVREKKHQQRVAARVATAQQAMLEQLQMAGISSREMLEFESAYARK